MSLDESRCHSCYYIVIDTNIIEGVIQQECNSLFVFSVVNHPQTCFKILFDEKCSWHERHGQETLFDEWSNRIKERSQAQGTRFICKPMFVSLLYKIAWDKVEYVSICDIADSIWRQLQRVGMRDIDDVKIIAIACIKASVGEKVLIVTDDSDIFNLRDNNSLKHSLLHNIEILRPEEFFQRFCSAPKKT